MNRYICVLDRAGWRITVNVYTPRPVNPVELRGLATAKAVDHLTVTGVEGAQPDEFTPVGFREVPPYAEP